MVGQASPPLRDVTYYVTNLDLARSPIRLRLRTHLASAAWVGSVIGLLYLAESNFALSTWASLGLFWVLFACMRYFAARQQIRRAIGAQPAKPAGQEQASELDAGDDDFESVSAGLIDPWVTRLSQLIAKVPSLQLATRWLSGPLALTLLAPFVFGPLYRAQSAIHANASNFQRDVKLQLGSALDSTEALFLDNEPQFWREMLRLRAQANSVRTSMFRANGPFDLKESVWTREEKKIRFALPEPPKQLRAIYPNAAEEILELRAQWYSGVGDWAIERHGRRIFERIVSHDLNPTVIEMLSSYNEKAPSQCKLYRATKAWPNEAINITIFDEAHVVFTVGSKREGEPFNLNGMRISNEAFAKFCLESYWKEIPTEEVPVAQGNATDALDPADLPGH
jgi:hypothetical protein